MAECIERLQQLQNNGMNMMINVVHSYGQGSNLHFEIRYVYPWDSCFFTAQDLVYTYNINYAEHNLARGTVSLNGYGKLI